jgi:hypothetical protein
VKNWLRNNPFLAMGILVAPFLLCIGFYSAGFGHSDYIAARLMLPFACFVTGGYFGAGLVVSIVALLQWPMYGLFIDTSSRKVRTIGAIIVVHGLLCWWLFTKGSENFR